jgi:hypothetical protein
MKQISTYFFLSVFLVLISIGANSQTNSALRNSVISTSGSSVTINGNKIVQQCIGQQGPIGLVSTSDIQVRQGFIQPTILKGLINNADITELQASVFPNPTSEFITLSFDDIVDSEINIYIYDVNGRLVLNKNEHCVFDVQFSVLHLQTGNYFIIVKYESKQFVAQVTILH